MTLSNTRVLLQSRPDGWVTPDNFTTDTQNVPDLADGQILIQNLYLSVDPYMRGRMNDAKSYAPPFQIGEPLQGGVVGKIVASRNDGFAEGDHVTGMLNWENYTITGGTDVHGGALRKIDPAQARLSYHLGILGMPGMTAYVGTVGICDAKEGETVFVTAASGAVGTVVGQIGKILGCRVVGSAGGPEKTSFLTDELGFDAAIDYKAVDSPHKAVQQACPDMIDVHFENVGGPMFEAALWNMNFKGRIALCGMIADYNNAPGDMSHGPRGMPLMIGKNLMIQGFIVSNYPTHCRDWIVKASQWMAEGKLKYRETIAEGVENAPSAFIGLLKGENFGKQIVQLADE